MQFTLVTAVSSRSQDADSMDKAGKKSEGAYYVWAAQEVDEVLGADSERGRAFKRHYYVKAGGNMDLSPRRSEHSPVQCLSCDRKAGIHLDKHLPCSDPHGEFQGQNCFIERERIEAMAGALGLSEGEAEQTLARAREMLHARRLKRPRPHTDNKASLNRAPPFPVASQPNRCCRLGSAWVHVASANVPRLICTTHSVSAGAVLCLCSTPGSAECS